MILRSQKNNTMLKQKVWIRQAQSRDAKQLQEINKVCLPECYSTDFWRKTLGQKHSFVAEVGKRPIGYLLADKNLIVSFAVMPLYRSQGIGKLLMKQYLSFYQNQLGAETVILHVEDTNRKAQLFYLSQGFRPKETWFNYYTKRNSNAVVMTHDLKSVIPSPPSKIHIRIKKG